MNREERNSKRIELINKLSNYNSLELLKVDNIDELLFEGRRVVIPNRYLRLLDLSEVSFDNKDLTNTNLSYTNAIINPQKVYNKDLSSADLEGIDLSNANFENIIIIESNLKNTNANINPKLVKNSSLCFCNLEGLNLFDADFTNVNIIGCNLKGTGAYIDPQNIYNKNLSYSNLEGLNMQHMNFTGINIENANLKNTNAHINYTNSLYNDKTILDNTKIKNEPNVSLMRNNESINYLTAKGL